MVFKMITMTAMLIMDDTHMIMIIMMTLMVNEQIYTHILAIV